MRTSRSSSLNDHEHCSNEKWQHPFFLLYFSSSFSSALLVIRQLIMTIITPERTLSIGSNESHGWFVTVTSLCEQPGCLSGWEKEEDHVRSLGCCQVHLNPSSSSHSDFSRVCVLLIRHDQFNMIKVQKQQVQLALLLFSPNSQQGHFPIA